jgi:hypothetical protein
MFRRTGRGFTAAAFLILCYLFLMSRIIAYIDGFNLYHAINDLRKPHLKWLDLWALCQSIARSGEQLIAVNYFSAYANWLPAGAARHRQYVNALRYHNVTCIMGHFKEKNRQCNNCQAMWKAHEEKETDVHIAVRLVADAYENKFDRAILITADSDLVPAINIITAAFPGKELFVAAPPKRMAHARDLKPRLEITPGRLAKWLLPATALDGAGKPLFLRPVDYTPPLT